MKNSEFHRLNVSHSVIFLKKGKFKENTLKQVKDCEISQKKII